MLKSWKSYHFIASIPGSIDLKCPPKCPPGPPPKKQVELCSPFRGLPNYQIGRPPGRLIGGVWGGGAPPVKKKVQTFIWPSKLCRVGHVPTIRMIDSGEQGLAYFMDVVMHQIGTGFCLASRNRISVRSFSLWLWLACEILVHCAFGLTVTGFVRVCTLVCCGVAVGGQAIMPTCGICLLVSDSLVRAL